MDGKTAAIVLAAGKGKRMESGISKQFMELEGRPLIFYALDAFEKSPVDEVVLVTGAGDVAYCREEIVRRYGFSKVTAVVEGGKERYHSVYAGLKALRPCSYVLIHDGARPCVTVDVIGRAIAGAAEYGACVAAMPVKDTIKIADEEGFAAQTPDRSLLWQVQTPQAFEYRLILEAYEKLLAPGQDQQGVTDDACVVETMTDRRVKLVRGDYANIKVTTPEDMALAKALLSRS